MEQAEDGKIFDGHNELSRRPIPNIESYPLLDKHGQEIPIFDKHGQRIERRSALLRKDEPQCGVLVKLDNIHGLFNNPKQHYQPNNPPSSQESTSHYIDVNAYPIAFLRTAGNIQASGIPSCFLPHVASINQSIRRDPIVHTQNVIHSDDSDSDDDDDHMDVDPPHNPIVGGQQVLTPIACQFYNYIAHRTATRAGNHDTMKGTVTAAIAGGFAKSQKDRRIADRLIDYCNTALPADRFKDHIVIRGCPSSCRAELVYSVDVAALRDPQGRYAFLCTPQALPSVAHRPFLGLSLIISFPLSQGLGTMQRSSRQSNPFFSSSLRKLVLIVFLSYPLHPCSSIRSLFLFIGFSCAI